MTMNPMVAARHALTSSTDFLIPLMRLRKHPVRDLLDPAGRTDRLRRRVGPGNIRIDLYLWSLRGIRRESRTDEISLGDYVLTGGELAAMTMIDATVRLIPEVIGKESSHQDDSFLWSSRISANTIRPYDYRGRRFQMFLMSGHHENIQQWRLLMSLKRPGAFIRL